MCRLPLWYGGRCGLAPLGLRKLALVGGTLRETAQMSRI